MLLDLLTGADLFYDMSLILVSSYPDLEPDGEYYVFCLPCAF